jgi:hypothetical protein
MADRQQTGVLLQVEFGDSKASHFSLADVTIAIGKIESGIQSAASGQNRGVWIGYKLALLASVLTWLIPIGSPLRVDETGSYWHISAGLAEIWPRRFLSLSFPAYSYILWFSTKLIGTSETALRMPSIVAMLGAVYLFYLAARELVDHEFAMIAAVFFALDPTVYFEAIDARPYGFAMLLTNAAILALVRLRRNDSNWLPAVFGLLCVGMLYFPVPVRRVVSCISNWLYRTEGT